MKYLVIKTFEIEDFYLYYKIKNIMISCFISFSIEGVNILKLRIKMQMIFKYF